ncbi:MAG TPA: hypothetical protein VGY31_02605 [Terriglobia bacterium]|nr:hypothetical protein [Terriglobia bacterium]
MATAPVLIPEPKRRKSAMRVAGRSRYPDVFFDKNIDNSRLVAQPDPAQRGKCGRVMGVCAAAFVLLFSIGMIHFECVRYGYEIAQLKSQSSRIEEANQKLRLDQALLSNPQRIDQLARQDLALAPSAPQQVIRLGDSGAPPQANGIPVMARNDSSLAPNSRGISREP